MSHPQIERRAAKCSVALTLTFTETIKGGKVMAVPPAKRHSAELRQLPR